MTRVVRSPTGAAALLVLLVATGAAVPRTDEGETPRKIGLEERAESRLAQIDITVLGPAEVVADLGPEDFKIRVNRKTIEAFRLDRLCGRVERADPTAEPGDGPATRLLAASSYLLYFDQTHLTLAGRQRAIDLARGLLPRLMNGTNRAMIVSSAAEVRIVQQLTTDRDLLDEGLDRLEKDRRQWDSFAELESRRVAEISRKLNLGDNLDGAMSLARQYQAEERWRTDRSLRRLEATMGQLVDLSPPKAVLYFADTTRSNPGEHYLAFFGKSLRESTPLLANMATDTLLAGLAFDRVVNEAAAQGIRVYPVEARGLTMIDDLDQPSAAALNQIGTVPTSSRVRTSDTHRTLESLAAETGGRAFLNGVGSPKIVQRILDDSSCVYLASFDPTQFDEDQPLRVVVTSRRDDVRLRVRGRLVVESEQTRLTSRLLRAFSSPDSIADPFSVRTGLVPTGFQRGRYKALLQIRVPPAPLREATWDLGASLISDRRVRQEASGRVSTSGSGRPVFFESEIELRPGAFDVVSVAHEDLTGLVASEKTSFEWPSLKPGRPQVGPIVLLQPSGGTFLREREVRGQGSMLLAPEEPLKISRPGAFVSLVCGAGPRSSVDVERRLVGPTEHEFPVQELSNEQGCLQLRDVMPSNTLRVGYYRFEVRLMRDGTQIAGGERAFLAEN